MEPYERGTLTDAERALWCVVSLSEQARILKDLQDGKALRSTGVLKAANRLFQCPTSLVGEKSPSHT